MNSSLITYNSLIQNESGIWFKNEEFDFDYSDGAMTEDYLKGCIETAADLSSNSQELEKKIIDWVSEYHLSPQRSNLLRALNFENVKNAVEIGCGCGAITRYLGELRINVDAVEGNIRRADIALRRCRDLKNVDVICANFNDLEFPDSAYDAVFLIGVLEYAGKFMPSDVSDQDAVGQILSVLKRSLKEHGVMVIAIENRMGLKYWMDASEDHYGQPYVGLYGYPKGNGIRTYDRREWTRILETVGFAAYQFVYPFPDYKLPRVLLAESYIETDDYAHSALFRIPSRDYTNVWRPDKDEFLLWENLHRSGYLIDFANSFLIVISDELDRTEQVVPFDFVHFSDSGRKPEFRTLTVKPKGSEKIQKMCLAQMPQTTNESVLRQEVSETKYIKGPLLSSFWLTSLAGCADTKAFENLVRVYYQFLLDYHKNTEEKGYEFDLIPSNIILDKKGSYQIIDKEWKTIHDLSPDYVLFRALLWVFHNNRNVLRNIAKLKKIESLREFIEYGFHQLSLPFEEKIDQYIQLEGRIQGEVTFHTQANFIRNILMEPLAVHDPLIEKRTFPVQLFWAERNQSFNAENSVSIPAVIGSNRQTLILNLPSLKGIQRLRFDPADQPGFFHLFKLSLKAVVHGKTPEDIIWQLEGMKKIAAQSQMIGIDYYSCAHGEVFLSVSNDPQLLFDIPEEARRRLETANLQLEVEMDCPMSGDYYIARDSLERKVVGQNRLIKEKEQMIRSLEIQIRDLEKTEAELDRIKHSRSWQATQFCIRILRKGFRKSNP